MENRYLKNFGSRIQTQLNGIKRPIDIAAHELSIDKIVLQNCINGLLDEDEVINIVNKIVDKYPIKISDIYLEKDTTNDGVIYCSNEKSLLSKRTIHRKNKNGEDTEYYNYYDCAMNKYCPFRPELIDTIRLVSNSDPENMDVAYNRGHLETQMTFYIGEVNFYYKVDNKKYCIETNSGDSSIKLPYIPHTFTTRDKSVNSRIIAVTFSSNIASNISNLSYVSHSGLDSIAGNLRNPNELFDIRLNKYLDRNFLNKELLEKELLKKYSHDDISKYFESNLKLDVITNDICELLNINKTDLIFNKLEEKDEVIVKKFDNQYHQTNNLLINKLVTAEHIKEATSFNVKLLSNDNYDLFESCYYQFIYNYSDNPFLFTWGDNMENHQVISKGDSLNIFPFVKHSYKFIGKESNFYIAKVSGVLNETILNEYSSFDVNNKHRLCDNETKKWW